MKPLQLDNFDHTILRLLQRDASLSMDAIAERVNLSRNACWRRIRNMEEAGIIRSRVALLDAEKLGLDMAIYVLIRTNRHDAEWLDAFSRAVRDMREIMGAQRLAGDLDYILRVRVSSVGNYDAFYQRLIAKVPISDVTASFVMEDLKDTTELPL